MKLFQSRKLCSLILFSFLALMPFMGGCGFFDEPTSDSPFIFPGVGEDENPGDGGSGTTDLCADVTCNPGETCNPADGVCQAVSPDPECNDDAGCPDSGAKNQICESHVCEIGCRVDGDCPVDQTCNASNQCAVNTCPIPPTCEDDETLDLVKCECVVIPIADACKVVWQAGIKSPENVGLKLYIDAKQPAQDLPNECSGPEEADEFGCVPGGGAETDTALIKECNVMSGVTKTNCLARRNVALIPFATRNQRPINLYFLPDNAGDPDAGGSVFMRTSEFPEYFIYNTSPELQANLIIDSGKGELVGPGRQIPEVIGQGTYSVVGGRISIDNLPLHFRAINLVKYDIEILGFRRHDDPPPSNFGTIVTDYANPAFNIDESGYVMSGLTCPTTDLLGVSIIPPLEGAPLVFTTGTNADAVPDPSILDPNPDVASVMTFTGCPLGPASDCDCTLSPDGDPDVPVCGTNPDSNPDQAWLNMVTGLTVPSDTCLAGLGGAALGAWIGGPVENSNGSEFTDLATACDLTDNGGSNGSSGDLNISVDYDGDTLTLDEPSDNVFEAEITLEDMPYYKEETDTGITDIAVLARFETVVSLTIRNDGSSSDVEPVFDLSSSNSAFEVIGGDLLNGTSLDAGQEKVIQVRFVPTSPQPSGCDDHSVDPAKWDCSTDISVFEGGALTLTVDAIARPPAAEIHIIEVGAVQGDSYDQPIQPDLIPGDGQVDYGTTPVGTPVIKAFEISNSGVRDLTVNDVQSQDLNHYFLGGAVRQGPSLSESVFSFGLLPALVPSDGSSNLYFYEPYWPSGNLPVSPADCDGKPCRVDGASVLIQTDVGPRILTLTGKMTLELGAKLEVYIEDPVLLNETIPDNPHLISCGGLLPSNVICVEGGTKAAVRVDPTEGYTAFRSDASTRGVYLVNGNSAFLADDLQVQDGDIIFDGGVDAAQWNETPESGLFDSGCIQLAAGEAIKIADIAYVPDGTALVRTLHAATLQVNAAGVNQGTACDGPTNESFLLNGALQGVSGAPDGSTNLNVVRMIAGINSPLPDGTKIVSTVTPGQVSRSGLSNSSVDAFSIPVIFDAANGIIQLQSVFTPLPPAFTGGPGQMRLFNPTASGPGSGGQWSFREHCQSPASDEGAGCSEFYLYISKDDPSFAVAAPPPPIYTNYSSLDGLAIIAKNPDTIDFSGDLIDAPGTYDPAGGKIQFTNNVAIRMFMHPATALTDRVDSAMVMTLTTECLADSEGNVLVTEPGLAATVPGALMGTDVFPLGVTQPPPFDSPDKNTMFGPNPLKLHMDGSPPCDAGASVLRGRRIGVTDTTGTLDAAVSLTGLTFDLVGVSRLKHNSPQLGAPRDMYVIIKACVEQGGPGSCDITP